MKNETHNRRRKMMQTSNGILGNKWATLVAGLALLINVASAQPQYNAVDIGSLGGSGSPIFLVDRTDFLLWSWCFLSGDIPNSSSAFANGINNSGQVVGASYLSDNATYHAFLYSGGTMTDLGTLIGPTNNSDANAINDNGQVVGESDAYYGTNGIVSYAFLYSGGTMSELSLPEVCGGPGPVDSSADGININGQAVGDVGYGCNQYAVLYSGGTYSFFCGGPNSGECCAFGINNNGQFVGQLWDTNVPLRLFEEAFLLSTNSSSWATPIFLGTLGGYANRDDQAVISCAYAINNSGQVVGGSYLSDNATYHAFVCSTNPGTMTDLGTLGGDVSCAYSININGQIVGLSYLSDNVTCHAFLCTNSGSMLDLNNLVDTNSLGTYLLGASGINDSGQIIANGFNGHAYLLTPASQAPPPAPVFLSITQTGDTVSFTWTTVPFYTYQVKYNSDLTSTNWNDLGSPVTATGSTLSATDALTPPQRFYRVLMQ
jgi:probable HAF family extracellular repeat protein